MEEDVKKVSVKNKVSLALNNSNNIYFEFWKSIMTTKECHYCKKAFKVKQITNPWTSSLDQ